MSRYRPFFLLFSCVSVLLWCSCLTPPPKIPSQVYSPEDLRVVSSMKRGKDFAASGRYDLAEGEFRTALSVNPNLDSALNDLGFVLMALNRFEEAGRYFELALRVAPLNIAARENEARNFYKMGELERAREKYQSILMYYEQKAAAPTSVSGALGGGPSPEHKAAIAEIYRSLATIDFVLGFSDEAACLARRARNENPTYEATGQLARLLLSLGRTAEAYEELRQAVISSEGILPPPLLLDYAITLFVRQDMKTADQALTRLLSQGNAENTERRAARLMKALIAEKRKDSATLELVLFDLQEDRESLCMPEFLQKQTYWPFTLLTALEPFLEKFCSYEQ